jgi:hypothetical protein
MTCIYFKSFPNLCRIRIRIRLRTLSTGEKHPLAESTATLEHTLATIPERDISVYSIRICGDYVGILVGNAEWGGNELVVWSWKTGVQDLMVSIVCTHITIGSPTGSFVLEVLSTDLKSFVFLNDNFILGSSCQHSKPALLVYKLKQRPADDTTETSTHLLRFLLGTHLKGPQGTSYILLASDPSPGWLPNAVPFHIAGDERTIAMYSQIFDGWGGAMYLIPAKTLLGQTESLLSVEGLDVEWETHGPQLVEYVPEHKRWDEPWPHVVFGMRYVLPRVVSLEGKPKILIRDLSPRRCLRASKEEREESDALYEATAWPSNRTGKPRPRSILTCVPLPENIEPNWNTRLLISEDGIVVVENVRETYVFRAAQLIR